DVDDHKLPRMRRLDLGAYPLFIQGFPTGCNLFSRIMRVWHTNILPPTESGSRVDGVCSIIPGVSRRWNRGSTVGGKEAKPSRTKAWSRRRERRGSCLAFGCAL